jgi:carbamoyl-phosphate synthase large subunit
MALKEDGFETIMINCNPETVSTDYDTSDRLYFEPLTVESVMSIVDREKPYGVIVQFGGQTPLRLSGELAALGVPIIGTSVESIDIAEDRERFSALVKKLGLRQPEFATARSLGEALDAARRIGFPLMIRPSFVLGGRAMRVLYTEEEIVNYMHEGVEVSHDRPVLLDRFLDNAIEVDLDALSDGEQVLIAGVMEHIEPAGIHSGDSSCCLPPQTLKRDTIEELKRQAVVMANELNVVGLMNIQFAVTDDGKVYILEVNPRASRTVPFVSKATGIPWAKVASRVMAGKKLRELGVREVEPVGYVSVKASVFPFSKFPGVDTVLGPEMKSTGEVMGIHADFAGAFAKSQFASNIVLPTGGAVFISVKDQDKEDLPAVARRLVALGFVIVATKGTAEFLRSHGIEAQAVNKVREGSPHVVDMLGGGELALVINTPEGWKPVMDSRSIRLVANELRIPTYTTIAAAGAVAQALEMVKNRSFLAVKALQDYVRAL